VTGLTRPAALVSEPLPGPVHEQCEHHQTRDQRQNNRDSLPCHGHLVYVDIVQTAINAHAPSEMMDVTTLTRINQFMAYPRSKAMATSGHIHPSLTYWAHVRTSSVTGLTYPPPPP
jgi:hypothetical protein